MTVSRVSARSNAPAIERRKPLAARVGVVSIGLDTYWKQFPGLLDDMNRKTARFVEKLGAHSVTVHDFGMIDNPSAAYEALPKIKAVDLDVLFVDMTTYGTSGTFGALARGIDAPIVLAALQPLKAMDYARGTTYMQLMNDDFCSVPEFTGVAIRMGRPVADVILGTLDDDPAADAHIAEWCRIAHVRHDLRTARIGHMGHVLESMLDMHTDPTSATRAFGLHVVQCEAEEILADYAPLTSDDPGVKAMKARILDFFDAPDPVSDPLTTKLTDRDLDVAARAAVALETFIESKRSGVWGWI